MKAYFTFLPAALLFCLAGFSQVGIGTSSPTGALDINSTTGGLVIPTVGLTALNSYGTIVNPQTGLAPVNGTLIYNTATAGVPPNNVIPGFYYWQGAAWVSIGSGGNYWGLTGNGGTTAGTNFVGTTDAQDIRFKTLSTDRFNMSHATNQFSSYGLGTITAPTYTWAADLNTGIFSPAADNLGFTTNGSEKFRIPNANQVHAMSLGTALLPFYSFSADPDTGIYSPTANTLAIGTNATEKVRVTAAGQVGIGTTAPQGVLDITSTTNGLVIPRVALTSRTASAPVVNPQGGALANGTMVYNTATAGTAPNNVTPGHYYWRAGQWRRKTDMIINTYIYPPLNINAGTTYTLTGTIADMQSYDAATVSIPGDWAVTPDITIEMVETRTGAVRFVVTNNTDPFTGTNYLNMDFAITTFKY